jgi:hypothetical protein
MAEGPVIASAPAPAPAPARALVTPESESLAGRKQELARTLESKREQGFRIESENETHAVLAIKGRRRWFGLAHGAGARYEITVDERGRASSRRL